MRVFNLYVILYLFAKITDDENKILDTSLLQLVYYNTKYGLSC